jgi:hypothetical protein
VVNTIAQKARRSFWRRGSDIVTEHQSGSSRHPAWSAPLPLRERDRRDPFTVRFDK